MAEKPNKSNEKVEDKKDKPKVEPKAAVETKGMIKVKAVIRPMHSPGDNILIPDEGSVLIKEGSWATSQLGRGLLKIVE